MKTMVKSNEFRFELFPHLPYSPDLTPATATCSIASKECSREKDLAQMTR